MDYEFYRVDYTICGVTYPGTLKILPQTGQKTEQKFAIGDKNGVLQCLAIKDEEPIIQFKTLPGKSITSVQFAANNNDVHGDKIFAASGNEVKGYTRKGKVFLTIETALSETITSMSVVGSYLIICSGRTITFYNDLQESNSYTCEDRVLDIVAFEKPNSTKLRLLVLIANKGTSVLENGQLVAGIAIPSGPSCLAVTRGPSNPTIDNFSLYGAVDGSIGIISYEQCTLTSKCLVEGQGLGSVVCLGWYSSRGNDHLAVGRHDGAVQLYLVDVHNLANKPRLKYTYFCGEPVTSIDGGNIGVEEQELLVATFSGRIFALRSGHQSSAAVLSKLPQDALIARRAKLEHEIARLEKQTANERDKYQRSTHSINSTLSTPPLLDLQHEVSGASRDGWLEVRLISAVPLDMLFIYCKTILLMQTDSAAVLSICPSQANTSDLLATVRCQANTRRLWVRIKRLKKSTPKPQSVVVHIYVLPAGAPRVARLISVRLPALAYYSRHEDLDCEKQSRAWCELRVSGSFSVAEITSWLAEALPGDLPRPATSINFARSHALIETLLICKYQRGLAIFKSDNVSTIAVMRSVISNCSVEKGINAEISYDVPQNCRMKSFNHLEHQFLLEYQKKRGIDLKNAISQLDLEINTINCDEQLLCDEYTSILNSSDCELNVTYIEELIDIVLQWNTDWHMLSISGENSYSVSEDLKAALQACNIAEISKILSTNDRIMPKKMLIIT